MNLDFAPMEGLTTMMYRRLHHKYFTGVDRYYTPFLSPSREHMFTARELREILPENNRDMNVIPQVLTKVPADFLWAAGELHAMGYKEINLNLGCPSGTVTAKGKGAGMLKDPKILDAFLDEIFEKSPCAISIKTRLGLEDPEEFGPILEIYNKYPIRELTIHPRIRRDFYKHPVRPKEFEKALAASVHPTGYNGDILRPADYEACVQRFPQISAVMIGRAMISDPFLAEKIKYGKKGNKEVFRAFHDELFHLHAEQFSSKNNALKRMKEYWFYMIASFGDHERHKKKLLKSKTVEEFLQASDAIFKELPLLETSEGGW